MKQLIVALLVVLPSITFGQWGVGFHQSNLPFVGVNYQIKNKIRSEVRIGTDNYFDVTSVEGIFTYDVLKKEDYELYFGLGARSSDFAGVVIPIGLNIYPLATKQFGFHIELAPIIGEETVLRGSWGIRYRFNKRVKGNNVN